MHNLMVDLGQSPWLTGQEICFMYAVDFEPVTTGIFEAWMSQRLECGLVQICILQLFTIDSSNQLYEGTK